MFKKYLKRPNEVPLIVATLSNDSYHLFLEIRLGSKPFQVVLDTGASSTLLDRQTVLVNLPEVDLYSGDIRSLTLDGVELDREMCTLPLLQVGDLEIKDMICALADFGRINQAYESVGIGPISGILGCDILLKYKAVIDLRKRILAFPHV